MLIVISIVLLTTYIGKAIIKTNKTNLKQYYENLKNLKPLGIVSYNLDDDCLISKDDYSISYFKYNGLCDIFNTDNYIFIYLSSIQSLIIPKRDNISSVNDFYKILTEKISHGA